MCNIYRNITIADYFPLDLRNDKTDMLSHVCVTKLSTKQFLLINEADRLRGQITSCWTWSSKTHFFVVCMFEGSVTSVMSSSLRPYGLQSARLLCPWENPRGSPGKTLEWAAVPSSRGSSRPGIEAASPVSSALAGGFLNAEPPLLPSRRVNSAPSIFCTVISSNA